MRLKSAFPSQEHCTKQLILNSFFTNRFFKNHLENISLPENLKVS